MIINSQLVYRNEYRWDLKKVNSVIIPYLFNNNESLIITVQSKTSLIRNNINAGKLDQVLVDYSNKLIASSQVIGLTKNYHVSFPQLGRFKLEFFPSGYLQKTLISISRILKINLASLPILPLLPKDDYFGNVLLLIHCQGANNSGIIIDVKKHSFTVSGKIVIVTIPKLFGTASLYFNGTSFLKVPTNEFEFPSDFTIEGWIFPTEYNNARFFAAGVTEGTNRVQLYVTSAGVLTLEKNTFGVILTGGFIALNTWTHIALSRQSGVVRLFINGTTIVTATHEAPIGNSSGFSVGGFINGSFKGYMDEIRVTKGISRYNTDFVLPTQPFPDN